MAETPSEAPPLMEGAARKRSAATRDTHTRDEDEGQRSCADCGDKRARTWPLNLHGDGGGRNLCLMCWEEVNNNYVRLALGLLQNAVGVAAGEIGAASSSRIGAPSAKHSAALFPPYGGEPPSSSTSSPPRALWAQGPLLKRRDHLAPQRDLQQEHSTLAAAVRERALEPRGGFFARRTLPLDHETWTQPPVSPGNVSQPKWKPTALRVSPRNSQQPSTDPPHDVVDHVVFRLPMVMQQKKLTPGRLKMSAAENLLVERTQLAKQHLELLKIPSFRALTLQKGVDDYDLWCETLADIWRCDYLKDGGHCVYYQSKKCTLAADACPYRHDPEERSRRVLKSSLCLKLPNCVREFCPRLVICNRTVRVVFVV